MLLLSYLYNISERQVEMLANDSLAVACFLGLGADDKAPDHSTLSLFKDRLLQQGGKEAYEGLFNEIVRIAQEKGVRFGPIQVVDSVHVIADVNLSKDKSRQAKCKGPRDPDACWGAKGHKVRKWADWDPAAGDVCAIVVDPETGVLKGGADPRRSSYAIGW
jgi:hypothetical protein